MPTTSEVSTRLLADNSQYRSVMNETVRVTDAGAKKILSSLDIKAGVGAIVNAIGLNLQSMSENVARFVLGFSKDTEEALERTVAATAKAADEQERLLAAARARATQAEKDAADRRAREVDLVTNARLQSIEHEKKAALESDAARRASNAELSRLNNEAAERRMSNEQRLADYRAQESVAIREIAELTRKGANRSQEENEMLIELKSAQADLQSKIKAITADTAAIDTARLDTAKAHTEELSKQVDLNNAQEVARATIQDQLTSRNFIIGGRVFGPAEDERRIEHASDAEIEEMIRRKLQDVAFVENTKGLGPSALTDAATGFLIHETVKGRLNFDISRGMQELAERNTLRQNYAFGGEDLARQKFAGNPLDFDGLFARFAKGMPLNETNELLRKISRQFDRGVSTVLVGSGNPLS